MRGRLVCGLVAAVAGVAVSAAGAGWARASLSPGPGSQLWVARYHGPSNTGDASSVAVSPDGQRVFVTGVSQGSTSGLDYATVAYNAATGARLWVTRYDGPGNGRDFAHALAVSPGGGTVYVTGQSKAAAQGDYATVAYNAATGAQRWAALYHGPATGQDTAFSVAVNPGGGAVYVTGASRATASGLDYEYATVAYNAATGAQLWPRAPPGPFRPMTPPARSRSARAGRRCTSPAKATERWAWTTPRPPTTPRPARSCG